MDRAQLERWIAAYERTWRTAGTAPLAQLFAADATYWPGPYERPHRGLEAIAAFWESEREGPHEVFEMESEIVAVEGDVGVARVEVRYGDPVSQEYLDLWIVRLDESGRCVAFEEWPFWPAGSGGTVAAGAGEP